MKKIVLAILVITVHISHSLAQTTILDTITSGGVKRYYRLYVPKNYNSAKLYPLVFNLHGYTSNASQQQAYSNFMPIADTAQFLLVCPDGISNTWDLTGSKDVQFISNLIDTVDSKYKLDRSSVYSCGMSMGGFMSYVLACVLNNKIAAIASVTGTMYAGLPATRSEERRV